MILCFCYSSIYSFVEIHARISLNHKSLVEKKPLALESFHSHWSLWSSVVEILKLGLVAFEAVVFLVPLV